jgi:rRNA maturation RNase YbeY
LKIGESPTPDEHGVNELGDLVMSMPYIRSYCKKRHKEVYPWVDRLIVHGVCHLLGYDHMNDPDEKVMRDREKSVMAEMKEIMAKEPLPPAPPKVAKKTKKTAGDVATSLSP